VPKDLRSEEAIPVVNIHPMIAILIANEMKRAAFRLIAVSTSEHEILVLFVVVQG
jgi:hypothetical protein